MNYEERMRAILIELNDFLALYQAPQQLVTDDLRLKKIRQIAEATNSEIPSDLNDHQYKYVLDEIFKTVSKTCKRGTWPEVGHFCDVAVKLSKNITNKLIEKDQNISGWTLDTEKINRDRLARGEPVSEHWLAKHRRKQDEN